jgi:hypothetical protein
VSVRGAGRHRRLLCSLSSSLRRTPAFLPFDCVFSGGPFILVIAGCVFYPCDCGVCVCGRVCVLQCTLNWTFASKWIIIAGMPVLAVACTMLVAIIVSLKNFLLEKYQYWRGKTLSPPTEIDALFGLLFASFYYLYLQVCAQPRPCYPCAPDVCAYSGPQVCEKQFSSLPAPPPPPPPVYLPLFFVFMPCRVLCPCRVLPRAGGQERSGAAGLHDRLRWPVGHGRGPRHRVRH